MVYLYDACDQISDFCHQQLRRKMRRKISWTDGRTDGRTEVKQYTPLPLRTAGVQKGNALGVFFHLYQIQIPSKLKQLYQSVTFFIIQHYVTKFGSDLRKVGGFPPGTPISSTNKTDCHHVTEILLNVALNTIILILYQTSRDDLISNRDLHKNSNYSI